jgi:alginate O-acetyltransferase complex protein AlgI
MLFNSIDFVFLFLPWALLLFTMLERWAGRIPALLSLIGASAYFYASWNPYYLAILAASVLANYAVGRQIQVSENPRWRRILIWAAIGANLLLLYYFKYFVYTLALINVSVSDDTGYFLRRWALPLGISFWTFQQINFLLERYNRRKDNLGLLDYVSIVMFFPHLIAGPIVRASELGPQVRAVGSRSRDVPLDIAVGVVLFVSGLAKKVLIADVISAFPRYLYQMQPGEIGGVAGPLVAWFAICAYMLQLYFDFSGYCDMSMGLARMFGFNFPINFNSPLKATSFVSFWRTWHITLTRFFTDTLHTPMAIALMRRSTDGGSTSLSSMVTLALPILFTFFLTGIWHGAGNQFVVFGILNGVFMAVGVLLSHRKIGIPSAIVSRTLTFALVSFVFIFFRAPDLSTGLSVARCVLHLPHAVDFVKLLDLFRGHAVAATMVLIGGAIAFGAPNLYVLMGNYHTPIGFKIPTAGRLASLRLRIAAPLGAAMVLVLLESVYKVIRSGATEFLYFQF